MTDVAQRIKPELLAPAGDFISLQAAIEAGCDAVYFGVAGLNMRRAAANFTIDDLSEIAARCDAAGVHKYLTLNTIIFDDEADRARQTIAAAAPLVDAVICWDPAVIEMARQAGIPIHISTQASVSNAAAVRFYQQLGATRIVPARECTLPELKKMKAATGMALEVFAHGAMCVSVSGRCYLSDFTYGKSGNRGACLQNCRREYEIRDVQEGHVFILGNRYVMSAKDVCTLPFLEQLCDCGIDAFKIEGRGRNPEYVRHVVRAYRRAIDAWSQDALTQQMKDTLVDEVKSVYNRTFSNGFYMGRPITEFVDSYGSRATGRKEYVGLVANYYRKIGVVEINVQSRLFGRGDKLMIQGETTGVVECQPQDILQDDQSVVQVERGVVTFRVDQRVRIGDKVYIWVDRTPEELAMRGPSREGC